MSKMFDQLAEQIFEILKGFGKVLTLFDKNGGRVYQPEQGRRMFAEPDKMMLTIDEDGSNSVVNISLSKDANIAKSEKLINTLRHLTTRFNVLFNVRKYNHSLAPKDFAYDSPPISESLFNEAISPLYGSIKTSYQRFGESKLVVKHSARINEEKRGSRSRNIHALFVEHNSEKFRFPAIHLSGARAWAQHVNQSGSPYDKIGEYIVTTAMESASLSKVNKHIKHNKLAIAEEVADLQANIRLRIYEIRSQFGRLSRQRGYPIESLKLDFDRKLNEDQDNQIKHLGSLLGIEGDHPLRESLMPLVHLTKGGNMTNQSQFRRVVALENADDLVEALTSEYGYKQGTSWNRNQKNVAFSEQEAFDAAKSYLELSDTKYKVLEYTDPIGAPVDKFLAYAEKWVKTSGGDEMGHVGDDWSPTDKKLVSGKASQLAQGLKELLSGRLQIKPVPAPSMKAVSPGAIAALKIGQILEPQAGLQNDMLHNYLSAIYEKLGSGEPLSPVEKQVAMKSGQIVDAMSSDVEEDIWVEDEEPEEEVVESPQDKGTMKEVTDIDEWFDKFDPSQLLPEESETDEPEETVDESLNEKVDSEKAFEYALDNFENSKFFDECGSDFNWESHENMDSDDLTYDPEYIINSIAYYLEKTADRYDEYEDSGLERDDFKHEATALFNSSVKPEMEAAGYTFNGEEPKDDPTTDESIAPSDELPPAGMVLPADQQHDFKGDISSRHITGGMTATHPYASEVARLRMLAGIH